MNCNSVLVHLRHPGWVARGNSWIRGHAFLDGRSLSADLIADEFSRLPDMDSIGKFASRLNGHYAAIVRTAEGSSCLVCDKCRSIPLFHASINGQPAASDDGQWLADRAGLNEFDPVSGIEFKCSGFVQGRRTLLKGLEQVQAGECVVLGADTQATVRRHYHQQRHIRDGSITSTEEFILQLSVALGNAVGRLIQFASGRPIVLAMSGGFDSTMIAIELAKAGYVDLRTFSYGVRGCRTLEHSRSTAEAIGLVWDHAEYSPESWRRWFVEDRRTGYYSSASGLSSLPHIEDWPAIGLLRQSAYIPDDAVIVNGQTAEAFLYPVDVMPGQMAPYSETELDPAAIADAIMMACYSLGPLDEPGSMARPGLKERLLQRLAEFHDSTFNSSLYEAWVAAERMAKFNINSVRNYEYWGHDWWLPLWDDEVREFWCRVPMPLRINRANTRIFTQSLYREFCGSEYRPGGDKNIVNHLASRFRRLAGHAKYPNSFYHLMRRDLKRHDDQIGWYGLFTPQDIRSCYHPGMNFFSLLALEYLGEIGARSPEEFNQLTPSA